MAPFYFSLFLSAAVAAALSIQAGGASPPDAPPSTEEPKEEILDYARDLNHRMTVPVSIDGQGPFDFVVDTGSERTVISRQLAQRLRLDPGATALVHSMSEASRIATVVIPTLQVGTRRLNGIHAPALDRGNLGAEGMLGVDSLQSQKVEFDFIDQKMTVTPSRRVEERWPEGTILVTARNRFGYLMLVDAYLEGERVYTIVDTGSQVTVGNSALRNRLARKEKLGPLTPVDLISVTGGKVPAEYAVTRQLRLGGVDITSLPVAFADVHPFKHLDLVDRPAIILGMDALKLFNRVSLDFANRKVRLLPPERTSIDAGTRMAHASEAAGRPRL